MFIDIKEQRFIEPKIMVFQSWIKSYSVGIFDYITETLNYYIFPHSIKYVGKEKYVRNIFKN
jgi:hypothetical protein